MSSQVLKSTYPRWVRNLDPRAILCLGCESSWYPSLHSLSCNRSCQTLLPKNLIGACTRYRFLALTPDLLGQNFPRGFMNLYFHKTLSPVIPRQLGSSRGEVRKAGLRTSWTIAKILVRESGFIELQVGFPRNIETFLLCANFPGKLQHSLGRANASIWHCLWSTVYPWLKHWSPTIF